MNYSSNYDFRSVDDITPEDIHITLLWDLRSHVNKENNPYMVDLWIIGMTKYRPVVPEKWNWMDDIRYLQLKGLLGIGNYTCLKRIVKRCKPLEEMIDRASEKILAIKSKENGKAIRIL